MVRTPLGSIPIAMDDLFRSQHQYLPERTISNNCATSITLCNRGVGDPCSNYAVCLYRRLPLILLPHQPLLTLQSGINCNDTYCGGDGADFFPLGDNSDPPVPRVYCISGNYRFCSSFVTYLVGDTDAIHIGINWQTSCGPSLTGAISLVPNRDVQFSD